MLCENCKKNQATIHYAEVINGMRIEHHICSRCATILNPSGYSSFTENDFPFVRLLTGLLASNDGISTSSDLTMERIKCPQCNMSFAEFARVGKFGCASCYDVFGPLIEENIKKIHGDIVHKGKRYQKKQGILSENDQNKKIEAQIFNLTMKQREAVELENYELAAKYRDEIRNLKQAQGKIENQKEGNVKERKHSNA